MQRKDIFLDWNSRWGKCAKSFGKKNKSSREKVEVLGAAAKHATAMALALFCCSQHIIIPLPVVVVLLGEKPLVERKSSREKTTKTTMMMMTTTTQHTSGEQQ